MEVDASRSDHLVKKVLQAEDEANRKVQESRARVKQAHQESEQELAKVKDEYIKRSDNERAKGEASVGYEKRRVSEGVRQAHRDADREYQTLKSNHEKEIHNLTTESASRVTAVERESDKKLTATQREAQAAIDREKRIAAEQINAIDSKFQAETSIKSTDHATKIAEFDKQSKAARDIAATTTQKSIADTKEHYENLFEKTQKTQIQSLNRLGQTTQAQLDQLRIDSSHKLNAYSQRNEDPFYRVVRLGLQLESTPEAFVVRAPIPEHEKDQVQLNVRGNELVVSGKRKNEEKIQVAPGVTSSTSSYQSYSETIPLDWPVETREISRSYQSGMLTIVLPKKRTYDASQMVAKADKSAQATSATAIRPNFPANLPGETALAEKLAAQKESPKKTPV